MVAVLRSSFGDALALEWLSVFAIPAKYVRAGDVERRKVHATFIGGLLSRHSIGQQYNYGG